MTTEASMIVLGIDVGGTKIAAGLVQFPTGEVLAERSIPTHSAQGGKAVLDRIVRLAETLAAEARARGRTISIIGLGVCELVDPKGRIFSHNCLGFTETDVRARLAHLAPLVSKPMSGRERLRKLRLAPGAPTGFFCMSRSAPALHRA